MQEGLSKTEVLRYGRQLILPEWGVKGQASLKSSAVLVVGVGGLGCPASLYLAAAGVGLLGLLDYDAVELSNLHRQVLHSEQAEGQSKVLSGQAHLASLNSLVKCKTHHVLLCTDNAMDIISSYDLVLDCTDNVVTRYLLNDACVLLGKPLISGSALRFEGQLTVYHYEGGPCFRCLFPTPPPPDTVTTCSEGGVMGPVPGVIGTMQALEAIKIVSGAGSVLSGKMFVFDGLAGSSRTVTLRGRQPKCIVCGDSPTVSTLIDYQAFCGSCAADDRILELSLLADEDRITCQEYHSVVSRGKQHHLIDVRPKTEFEICHLNNAINIPLKVLQSDPTGIHCLHDIVAKEQVFAETPVCMYVCCRRGNDSQLAVVLLKEMLTKELSSSQQFKLQDIIGGLNAWADVVDQTFPKY